MSETSRQAPQIPNLRTLAPPRGGLRGRARNRGGFSGLGAGSHGSSGREVQDAAVQKTDDDAATMRRSAVERGYLVDEFAGEFTKVSSDFRFPIMNRGTYLRTMAIDTLIDKFLSTNPSDRKQIISLGAGTDTRFFRLASRQHPPDLIYHELDFPTNTQRKIEAIQRSSTLTKTLHAVLAPHETPSILPSRTQLLSTRYNIHPLDLRTLHQPPTPSPLPNLSPTTPTLILSECCLCYLPATQSSSALTHLLHRAISPQTPAALIIYEPIHQDTAFGARMRANLAARNVHMPGLDAYDSLAAQRDRLRSALSGPSSNPHEEDSTERKQQQQHVNARAADALFLYHTWIPRDERRRVEALEMLDELEEWELMLRHYCVAWGWRDGWTPQEESIFASGGGGERDEGDEDEVDDGVSVFSQAWGGVAEQVDKEG